MEAILKFNLPEDHTEFELATKGNDWSHAMWELDQWLRSQTKHAPDTMSEDTFTAFEQTRDKLHEILQENSLKL
jgi:hypothetical protein